jgi:DNA polymerase III subunit delta
MTEPVVLVKGEDQTLVGDAVREAVNAALDGEDRALAMEELAGEELVVGAVVDAALTAPFLTARRVLVVRDVGRWTTDEVEPLVTYLADPLETTCLVLVAGGGATSQRLVNAVKKAGRIVDAGAPTGRARTSWVADRLKAAPVRLDAPAGARLAEHLGEDLGRLSSILDVLVSTYGEGARIGIADLEPFLGGAGGVAPWDLTDAIDRGEVALALENLHRLLGAGRHPLVVLATLHNHYTRILRLDGADAADEKAAAALLGITGSTFPAKKALSQSRRLGHDAVIRAVTLLADADLALKGAVEWPEPLVLEVLVARLSRLGPRPKAGSRR